MELNLGELVHLDAYQMVKDNGLAVELRVDRKDDEGFVSAEKVEKRVRVLMGDSEEVRKVKEKTREMMVDSRRALKEGGS
ncbi:putative anthocyanidin 3-O-glucosyltransferase [Dioscorea sansibarensis]